VREALAAIIVGFNPEHEQLTALIRRLIPEFEIVYIMDNGRARAAVETLLAREPSLRLVDMDGNQGIGTALNRGFELARAAGVRYVMTFDQDSTPPPGLAGELLQVIERLAAQGTRVAAVGPRIVDPRQSTSAEHGFIQRRRGWPMPVMCTADSQLIEADFLITSGCLVSLASYLDVGPFDAGLFVDLVDMEWCLRARAAGYKSFGVCAVVMPHDLGLAERGSALGLTVIGYNPVRRYFYARNTIRLLRMPHVIPGWKLRLLLSLLGRLVLLPVAFRFSSGWTKHWLMLSKGVIHGIANVSGPYVERGRAGR
jgi:rhamnosyltransferase